MPEISQPDTQLSCLRHVQNLDISMGNWLSCTPISQVVLKVGQNKMKFVKILQNMTFTLTCKTSLTALLAISYLSLTKLLAKYDKFVRESQIPTLSYLSLITASLSLILSYFLSYVTPKWGDIKLNVQNLTLP